jgi:hypothetical protein
MTTVFRAPPTVLQFFGNNGTPLIGGTLLTQVGGVNAATYQDAAGTIPLPNPIPLNSRGEVSNAAGQSCELFLTSGVSYTFTLFDAQGNQIGQYPNIAGILDGNYSGSTSAFSQSASYGTGTIGAAIQSRWICVTDAPFNADPTGVTDSTSAMQAAHNTGQTVYYPKGTYKFSIITITAGGIVGSNLQFGTQLISTDTSAAAGVITGSAGSSQPGASALLFQNFLLVGNSGKTSGAGLLITAPSGENAGTVLDNVQVYNFPNCLQFGAASGWSIQNCSFINYKNVGVYVDNTNNPDSGDSVIAGSLMTTSVGTSQIGLFFAASGGLKVIGNKINGGKYGFFLGLTASAPTSDLLLLGNSIENQTVSAIELSRSSGTATFSNLVIVGNQLAINPNGIVTDSSGFLSNVVISGNSIRGTTASCVSLNNVSLFNISGNVFQNNSSGTAIGIAANCSSGKIGKNTYSGFVTTVNNLSSTTFVDGDIQSGTVNVTTSTGYGSLFTGSASVTFPTPFTVPPNVICNVGNSANGAVSAYPTNVTVSGFTMNVIGINSGGVTTGNQWVAQGVV